MGTYFYIQSRIFILRDLKVIGSIALTSLNGVLVARETGKQSVLQTSDQLVVAKRLGFASRELYQICIGTTKLGICAFYLRIFQDRFSKLFIWSLMGFVATFTLALSIGIIFQCQPISGAIFTNLTLSVKSTNI